MTENVLPALTCHERYTGSRKSAAGVDVMLTSNFTLVRAKTTHASGTNKMIIACDYRNFLAPSIS